MPRINFQDQMMTDIEYVTFKDALQALPDSDFKDLTSSTIPLLNYWKNKPTPKINNFVRYMGFRRLKAFNLFFEYAIPSLSLKDDPHCADLMLISDELTIAFEAQWNEPKCDTIGKWLNKGNRSNRKKDLKQWLCLIQPFARNELRAGDFSDIPYEFVHRTAAACAVPADRHALVYQIFWSKDEELPVNFQYYDTGLERLHTLIKPTANLSIGFIDPKVIPNRKYATLQNRIREERNTAAIPNIIRDTLAKRNIFTFEEACSYSTWCS